MRKINFLKLSVIAMLIFAMLAGCTAGDGTSPAEEEDGGAAQNEEPVKLVFSMADNPETSTDLTTQLIGKSIKEFNESGQGAEIEIQVYTGSDYYTKLNALAAAKHLARHYIHIWRRQNENLC
jgi:ABC-type glycerol-3-phosphate transport system substrate-binding protein